MAVLGVGGQLKLHRQVDKKTLTISSSDIDTTCNKIKGAPSWLWNGDQIHVEGLPIYCDGTIYPGKVSGYASYAGSKWFLGPNRTQITDNNDKFYKVSPEAYPPGNEGDAAFFYSKNGVGPVPEDCGAEGDYWVHVDTLGYVSFYTDRCSAFAGSEANRIDLAPVYGDITLKTYGTSDYQNASWDSDDGPCGDGANDYWYSNVLGDYPGVDDYDNADVLPRTGSDYPGWQILCGIREWSLDLKADAVDTTSVSEKFGDAVKSLVNGGGNLEFFIDRNCYSEAQDNSLMLMQLLLMTEKGCEAEAEFWLMNEPLNDPPYCNKRIGGGLYYRAKILITGTAINLRPTELVAGSAEFVTVEEIRLNQTP